MLKFKNAKLIISATLNTSTKPLSLMRKSKKITTKILYKNAKRFQATYFTRNSQILLQKFNLINKFPYLKIVILTLSHRMA